MQQLNVIAFRYAKPGRAFPGSFWRSISIMNTQPIEAIIAALAQLMKPHLETDNPSTDISAQLEEMLPSLVRLKARAYLDEYLPSMVEQCVRDVVDQAVETYLDDNLEDRVNEAVEENLSTNFNDRVSDAVSTLTFSVSVE